MVVWTLKVLFGTEESTGVDYCGWWQPRGVELFLGIVHVSLFPLQLSDKGAHISRYHGGWLAPNIYFLGHAGCVQVNGIRIAGMSGIYKAGDYRLGTLFPYTLLLRKAC